MEASEKYWKNSEEQDKMEDPDEQDDKMHDMEEKNVVHLNLQESNGQEGGGNDEDETDEKSRSEMNDFSSSEEHFSSSEDIQGNRINNENQAAEIYDYVEAVDSETEDSGNKTRPTLAQAHRLLSLNNSESGSGSTSSSSASESSPSKVRKAQRSRNSLIGNNSGRSFSLVPNRVLDNETVKERGVGVTAPLSVHAHLHNKTRSKLPSTRHLASWKLLVTTIGCLSVLVLGVACWMFAHYQGDVKIFKTGGVFVFVPTFAPSARSIFLWIVLGFILILVSLFGLLYLYTQCSYHRPLQSRFLQVWSLTTSEIISVQNFVNDRLQEWEDWSLSSINVVSQSNTGLSQQWTRFSIISDLALHLEHFRRDENNHCSQKLYPSDASQKKNKTKKDKIVDDKDQEEQTTNSNFIRHLIKEANHTPRRFFNPWIIPVDPILDEQPGTTNVQTSRHTSLKKQKHHLQAACKFLSTIKTQLDAQLNESQLPIRQGCLHAKVLSLDMLVLIVIFMAFWLCWIVQYTIFKTNNDITGVTPSITTPTTSSSMFSGTRTPISSTWTEHVWEILSQVFTGSSDKRSLGNGASKMGPKFTVEAINFSILMMQVPLMEYLYTILLLFVVPIFCYWMFRVCMLRNWTFVTSSIFCFAASMTLMYVYICTCMLVVTWPIWSSIGQTLTFLVFSCLLHYTVTLFIAIYSFFTLTAICSVSTLFEI